MAVLGEAIQIGAQGAVREVRLPAARGQLFDIPRRMLSHPLQDIHQVGIRIDVCSRQVVIRDWATQCFGFVEFTLFGGACTAYQVNELAPE